MRLSVLSFLILALSLTISSIAIAEEGQPVDCSASCPDGQVLVSFADGNKVTCICQEPAEMEPTVPDPEIVDDGDQPS